MAQEFNPRYMARALELAAHGRGFTSPNPMVGAVIVYNDTIIGEGYHRQCGKAHAEVNAINMVADRSLLPKSTIYVTLEPCSHYGKTPPCAQLIADCHIPRVIVGATDPFAKVSGRGIAMLEAAGAQVIQGVMERECQELNARFFTAHTLHRPFITLKWAQSSDQFMDSHTHLSSGQPAHFSNTATIQLTHRLRSLHDAILTTSTTVNADNPLLTVRAWYGRNPRPVILDRRGIINPEAAILGRDPICYNIDIPLPRILEDLYSRYGITSILVEAGPTMLNQFIDANLWDMIRVETAPIILGTNGTCQAPKLNSSPILTRTIQSNRLDYYTNNPLLTPTALTTTF